MSERFNKQFSLKEAHLTARRIASEQGRHREENGLRTALCHVITGMVNTGSAIREGAGGDTVRVDTKELAKVISRLKEEKAKKQDFTDLLYLVFLQIRSGLK